VLQFTAPTHDLKRKENFLTSRDFTIIWEVIRPYSRKKRLYGTVYTSEVDGQFYLATLLDAFSRYVIAWKLCTTMAASDVIDTLELALTASGCTQALVRHRPQLLSDNGPSYVAGDLADWLASQKMEHIRGAPCHPPIQSKIERWH
jgi:transposase InsO family protein